MTARCGPALRQAVLRPAHVGQQQDRAHQFLDRLAQVGGRHQRFDLGEQVVGVFEVIGGKVAVQQRERFGEQLGVERHQPREILLRSREARHPGVDGVDGRWLRVVAVSVVSVELDLAGIVARRLVELEHPRVEPLALGDRRVQFGMAAKHHRIQPRSVEARRQRAAIGIGDVGQPLPDRHRLGLQQHAAQVAVEHARVERFQWRGHGIEQGLQLVELARAECRQAGTRWRGRRRPARRMGRGCGHAGIVARTPGDRSAGSPPSKGQAAAAAWRTATHRPSPSNWGWRGPNRTPRVLSLLSHEACTQAAMQGFDCPPRAARPTTGQPSANGPNDVLFTKDFQAHPLTRAGFFLVAFFPGRIN